MSCLSVDNAMMVTIKMEVLFLLHVEKDVLRKTEPAGKWLSCVALLCQTFSRMRMSDDRPFELLVRPVFEVLILCLSADASENELACATTQVGFLYIIIVTECN